MPELQEHFNDTTGIRRYGAATEHWGINFDNPILILVEKTLQTFTTEFSHTITSVKLWLTWYSLSSAGSIKVEITAVDINHLPTGSILATSVINSSVLPLYPSLVGGSTEFAFTNDPPLILDANTEYGIIISANSDGHVYGEYIEINCLAVQGSDPYPLGKCALGFGTNNIPFSWGNFDNRFDTLFEVYGELLLPEKPTCITPDNEEEAVAGNAHLEWHDPGEDAPNYAKGYDVYFGTSPSDLHKIDTQDDKDLGNNTSRPYNTPDSGFVNYYTAGETYYWRIDAWNDAGTTTGDVWHFKVFKFSSVDDDRPDNPDGEGDDGSGDYNGDITVAGGGRHGSYLIVVDHKRIYVRRA